MTYRDGFTPVEVLLVEDDAGDALMTREAFEFHKVCNPLHIVTDGEQALQFVRREGPFADAPRPGLILLDVNLPRLNGLEVLAELKQDPDLMVIPVVMLTTSRAEEDILRSYKLHANAYVTKPVDFEHFVEAIKQIDNFFLTLVQLPRGLRSMRPAVVAAGMPPWLSSLRDNPCCRDFSGGLAVSWCAHGTDN
jgi:CheY-like chemotaxis protein